MSRGEGQGEESDVFTVHGGLSGQGGEGVESGGELEAGVAGGDEEVLNEDRELGSGPGEGTGGAQGGAEEVEFAFEIRSGGGREAVALAGVEEMEHGGFPGGDGFLGLGQGLEGGQAGGEGKGRLEDEVGEEGLAGGLSGEPGEEGFDGRALRGGEVRLAEAGAEGPGEVGGPFGVSADDPEGGVAKGGFGAGQEGQDLGQGEGAAFIDLFQSQQGGAIVDGIG